MAPADHKNPLLIPTLQEILSSVDNLLQCIEKDWSEEAEIAIKIVQNDLLQLTDSERATCVGSIRQHLSSKEHGDRACAMLNIELPDRPINMVFALDNLLQTVIDAPEEARLEGLKRLIAALATQDPVTVEHYAQQVKKANLMGLVAFRRSVGESAKALPKNKEPADKPSTWPYRIEHGRICYLYYRSGPDGTKLESNPVADFTAKISSEITDENGARTFVVEGVAIRGGAFAFEMDAEDFGSDYRLKATIDAASGARDPVRAGMGKHLSPALQLLTGDRMKRLKRYRRTGWADGRFLIPGRKLANTLVEPSEKLVYSINADADAGIGLTALEDLLISIEPQRSTVILSFMFQAPLSHLAGWRNKRYALFISGRSGSLKTSFAMVAMSLYGPAFNDESLLIKWGEGATRNSVMFHACHAHDLPLLIDNYKPSTGDGPRAFINLIHNIVEGGDRDRLKRSGVELQRTKKIYCWPLCTGEDIPDTDPASLARILSVPFLWQQSGTNEPLSRAQQASSHLCAIGHSWLTWLESDDGHVAAAMVAEKFEDYRQKWCDRLHEFRVDMVNPRRVATNLATNELTWEVMEQHPLIGKLARHYHDEHQDGLLNIVAVAMSEATAEALEARRFLSALRELLTTKQVVLLPKEAPQVETETEKMESDRLRDRRIGWQDDDILYLLPRLARKNVESLLGKDGLGSISNTSLYKQLDELDVLSRKGKKGTTVVVRVRDKSERVLCLKATALESTVDVTENVTDFKTSQENVTDFVTESVTGQKSVTDSGAEIGENIPF